MGAERYRNISRLIRKKQAGRTGICCAWILVLLFWKPAVALVNPQLQPSHIRDRYLAVIGGRITSVDYDNGRVHFQVTGVSKGAFEPKTVRIDVREVDFTVASLLDDAREGGIIVGFVGKQRRRHEKDVLLYAGQQWHQVQLDSLEAPGVWHWEEALGDEMVGTFNGAAEQLLVMMKDAAAGRYFFPSRPTVKFKKDLVLGDFKSRVRGGAVYDIDNDGRLDVYACNENGNRAYIQTGSMQFEDRTKKLKLDGVAGVSCSFADVDADGDADMLADGMIYLGSQRGFERSSGLSVRSEQEIRGSAYVEVNGDGLPDVVVSLVGGGLRLYVNDMKGGGGFRDATHESGLDGERMGAGKTGFFAPGYWNDDSRIDLYYGADKGYILIQNTAGRFEPVDHSIRFEYRTMGTAEEGLTGAGCFAPLWTEAAMDLVAPADMHFAIVTNAGGTVRNVTGYGNEIRLGSVAQFATLAEDLNMDGYVDLLTISRKADAENPFHANRGYGSYMMSELYMNYEGFPAEAFRTGAWGIATGDINNDGANDLVFGGPDGKLRLVINDAFSHELRKPAAHPTLLEQTLSQSRILTVKFDRTKGVLGADVQLANANGHIVARRMIGSHVLTGCCGPDALNLVLREPVRHTLMVRLSDGQCIKRAIEPADSKRTVVRIGDE